MIETPKIVTLKPQTTAKIYQVIPCSQIQQEMGKALGELKAAILAQGIAVTGPWFTHHLQPPGENFNFEIGFPVAAVVKASGRVQPGEWPAMSVARTVYHGGYQGLGGAWGEFMEWIEKNDHNVTDEIWERYLLGPESGSDATAWETELNRLLIEKRTNGNVNPVE
jgi:effector-binding domain-containing protein